MTTSEPVRDASATQRREGCLPQTPRDAALEKFRECDPLSVSGENTLDGTKWRKCGNGTFESYGVKILWLLAFRTDRKDGWGLLPNLLPLPAKSSPKQDESRANNVDYVIEI